ncbi:hypothetical protein AM588_10006749 [Phytophthora nicotianae]|uniref:Origin recognition complex subunit 5 C-terminal domain-containing protein n=1 Tax=Phytophthora nicotianae TaxID=4792 RepID=A0A0W8DMP6_PHYNI|nr:hypothetical protein AM588_10006749 [Phytophthora nicotianae]
MIGREAPLAELSRATGLNADAFESPLPLVIVYGGASSGKSMGVAQALRAHPSPHALVDCTALYSAKEFYREALAQLHDGAMVAESEDVRISVDANEPEENKNKQVQDDEKFSSLNFLGFFKALDRFMEHNTAKGDEPSRRVLYLALDHVDKLLDRGLGAALLTCVCTINDQISYLNVSFDERQLADILVEQLGMKEANEMFRTWLVHLHGLLPPAPDGDWLEFRAAVVHLLPEFRELFLLPVQGVEASRMKTKLERYLASFNPQETDVRFLSSSGGQRRKKRAKKNPDGESSSTTTTSTSSKKQQISQLLVGPRIFTLQRLLAIYLNLRVEAEAGNSAYDDGPRSSETREEVFTHLATLVRMQLFQRTTPPHVLDNIKFRCLADARFVQETARYLSFPLDAYLNRAT